MNNRNLKLFYLHELLFQFSDTMLVLVLPIFMYRLFGSISAVFLLIMAWNLIHGLLFLPVFNLAMKSGRPKYFMMTGVIFYISALYLFSLTTATNKIMILPALIVFSLYISFYWMVRHWFISVNSDYKVIGRQMSIVFIIQTMIAFVAPIAGGAISYFISFNAAFLIILKITAKRVAGNPGNSANILVRQSAALQQQDFHFALNPRMRMIIPFISQNPGVFF